MTDKEQKKSTRKTDKKQTRTQNQKKKKLDIYLNKNIHTKIK